MTIHRVKCYPPIIAECSDRRIFKMVGTDIVRVLYFFYFEGKIVFTNGFVKKTQKTPREEIRKAKEYRKDYIERSQKNEKI